MGSHGATRLWTLRALVTNTSRSLGVLVWYEKEGVMTEHTCSMIRHLNFIYEDEALPRVYSSALVALISIPVPGSASLARPSFI